jgi:hypothetical protein
MKSNYPERLTRRQRKDSVNENLTDVSFVGAGVSVEQRFSTYGPRTTSGPRTIG